MKLLVEREVLIIYVNKYIYSHVLYLNYFVCDLWRDLVNVWIEHMACY